MRLRRKQAKGNVRQPHLADDSSYAFRRSRTITGSVTDSVRAAGEDRGQLRSPRLHEHSLRRHRRKLFAYLFLVLVACGGLWYVISSYLGGQVSVGTSSTQAVSGELDADTYQSLVRRYFNEHPFEQFSFSLNEAAFSNFMAAHASEVESAVLAKSNGFGAAALSLSLREPVVTWTIKSKQYFVDDSGEAFTRNYFATPSVAVVDKSGVNAELGAVTSGKLLHFIARAITLVNKDNVASPVVGVELPAGSTREVDFKLQGKDYIIKGNLDRDPAGQAADITNAVRYVDSKGINPAYLDVRVAAKAYYRDR